MKSKINKLSIIPILFIFLVALSISVNAFAVSMPYLPDKTITLYPGASTEFEVILQNMVSEDDETAIVTIEEGNEIAMITDKETTYKIPKGTKDTKVHIKIDIPIDTELGTTWNVRFKAIPVTEKVGGMVQLSGGVSDYFKVKAGTIPEQLPLSVKKSTKGPLLIFSGAVLLVLIIVICLIIYRRKKN